MKYLQTPAILLVLVLGPAASLHSQDQLRITEFLAINDTGLDDADRDEEDWIEIHNAGRSPASLEGWYLTDTPGNPTKWKFPAVALESDAYLVVFASGKDRRDPAGELHTNFKLSGTGEYLALVRPDGVNVVSEFSPAYPIQAPDVSYGLVETATQKVLLPAGSAAQALVPLDNSMEPQCMPDEPRPWTLEDFDDSAWLSGTTGVGYGYPGMVGLDVSSMLHVNETVYVRIPFVVEDPSEIRALTLRMRFDDGMIAYLNGQEVARDNTPAPTTETWNSGAPASWPNSRVVNPVDFSVRQLDVLHVGTNVLAVHGLNYGPANPDLLMLPELLATVAGTVRSFQYFPVPTPGGPNGAGVETMGPIIADVGHHPQAPTRRDALQITARISPSFDAVAAAHLYYRVMFGVETALPLLDDGRNGDGERGDGVFGATIPAGVTDAGQMVRWYIVAVDAAGRVSRFPTLRDPQSSPHYDGAVVADPSLFFIEEAEYSVAETRYVLTRTRDQTDIFDIGGTGQG